VKKKSITVILQIIFYLRFWGCFGGDWIFLGSVVGGGLDFFKERAIGNRPYGLGRALGCGFCFFQVRLCWSGLPGSLSLLRNDGGVQVVWVEGVVDNCHYWVGEGGWGAFNISFGFCFIY